MTVKVIFIPSYCSSLYTAFAVLTAYKGLNIILAAIKIIISGVVVAVVVIFIYQLGSLSDSDLNFILTI